MTYSIGIDIGTGSVRAALVHIETGKITKSKVCDIKTFNPQHDYYEQSSENIYEAICDCVKEVTKDVQVKDKIVGIGVDATCSLVVVDENGNALSVSKTGEKERNIILWMDHRAMEEASLINKTGHPVLKYVGGTISPEMETPKILWIKNNLPELYNRIDSMTVQYFDLADWVVYKMTGNNTIRGSCTTVCKWTYVSGKGWDKTYFDEIGLGKLSQSNFKAIGEKIVPIGTNVGTLLPKICEDFGGLSVKTVISAGIIDAHGAGIGCMGGTHEGSEEEEIDYSTRMALIAGTSCCHMAVNRSDVFVPGVWGPYRDAMIPGYSLSEGGQSAVGEALAHVIRSHPFSAQLEQLEIEKKSNKFDILLSRLKELASLESNNNKKNSMSFLTKEVHILPYFHGNRSPIADPSLKGMICGLSLDKSLDNLAILFLATIQALAYGTKHIVDEMNSNGHTIREIYICGGLNKNEVYKREHCQILNMNIVTPKVELTPCLGSAILGAVAAKVFPSIESAMSKMCKIDEILRPVEDEELKLFHIKKYKIYRKMYDDQMTYRKIMCDE